MTANLTVDWAVLPLRDFTARGAIAVTAVGICLQAYACQPAAERASARRLEQAVTVQVMAERAEVRPGAHVRIAVTLLHQPGYHSWPNEPVVPKEFEGVRPIPTTVEVVEVPSGVVVGDVVWPRPSPVTVRYTGSPVTLLSYVDTIVAFVPLTLPTGLSAEEVEVLLRIRFQTCDESYCYSPRTVTRRVSLRIVRIASGASSVAVGSLPTMEVSAGSIHPNGTQLAIIAAEPVHYELWVLRNMVQTTGR